MSDVAKLLDLVGVSVKRDGATLLANVSLAVSHGERLVVLGANGAGKSTLLKVANGVLVTDAGQISAPPRARQAHVLQRPAVLARSVVDNVRFVLSLRGCAEPERSARARWMLSMCDLESHQHRHAQTLSGGERQRLALACAWASEPDLLFADEPTANLAPSSAAAIERLLLHLHEAGCTLVMTTHNVAQARRMATRIVFLDSGRVVEDRSAADFFSCPVSLAARAYLDGERL
ncbi:MAG: ABC transporter ATP-binding protein [Burkholderiales bacterium]|nr:ABC transporter ATP-binding protein [Burkholderiales bacterium]